ncbi:hypothetical protein Cfor_04118, partial [Coptotermes formosanus]
VTIQTKFYFGVGSYHRCGGSIIDSEHILTAAHCVTGLSPADLVVFAGVLNNTQESSEDTKVVRQVTELFVHEGFVYGPLINDIAIMKVSPGFPTDNSAVKAIPLRQDVAPDGLICTVSGWGSLGDSDGTMPQNLQVVMVPFITYDTCRYIYSNYTEGSIEPGMNCAGFLQGGKDACGGDSGGPLVCGGLLTGVVSWGEGCALPNFPGVYADVAYYKEWIERQLLESKGEFFLRN